MRNEIIRVEKLKKNFGNRELLKDAWLDIGEGQTVGIAGLDGSGRSTLLKTIAGLLEEDDGEVYYEGTKVEKGKREILRKNVAYITNESGLVDSLSIIDNMFIINKFPQKPWLVTYKNIREKCREILEELHIHTSYSRHCGFLEDSEKQRLEIMKNIMAGAKLIILNCTSQVYSEQDIQELMELMERTKKQGIAYIFITNELDYMMSLSDSIFVMREGRTIRNIARKKFDKQQIYTFMSGYRVDASLYVKKKQKTLCNKTLELFHVDAGLLREVSLQVYRGEIVGILSFSNRWNDDLMRTLMGNKKIEKGSILRNEKVVSSKILQNHGTLSNRSCYMIQPDMRNELYYNLTPQQNYVLLAQQKTSFFPLGVVSKTVETHLQNASEEELGFSPELFQKSVYELSNKERFELIMGRIRLFHPDLLVMNSPMEVADIFLKKRMLQEFTRITKMDTGILLTGANYEELAAVCDRIFFQVRGTITESIEWQKFSCVELEKYLV